MDNLLLLWSSQHICRFFDLMSLVLPTICCFHVNLESMARPRYLAVGCCGMAAPFRVTDGDVPGLREKVVCTDFSALMITFHLFSHGSIFVRACCSPCVVNVRVSAETSNAVSSA